jgi:hypothetical protein
MRSQMNFLPSAVAIVFADSTSSQCKTRHRVLTGAHKRSACCCFQRSRHVSEAFTCWFCVEAATLPARARCVRNAVISASAISFG